MFKRSTKNDFTNTIYNFGTNSKRNVNSFFSDKEETNKKEHTALRMALVRFEKSRDLNEFFNNLGKFKDKYASIYINKKIDKFFEDNKINKEGFFDIKEILNKKEIQIFKNFRKKIVDVLKQKDYMKHIKYKYIFKKNYIQQG